MVIRTVVIGTRGSALALWQAEDVLRRLQVCHPDIQFVLKRIQTGGDANLQVPLSDMGTRGIFVKEIETALLAGEIDLAVHSLKDLPSECPPGLVLAAVGPREDPRDVLVSRDMVLLSQLPQGSRIGTSSPRRAAQILALRPDLIAQNVRGNVETRVRKVANGDFDAVVLAAAGLRRLGLESHVSEFLPFSTVLPAPGQGIVAVEARVGDDSTLEMVGRIDHLSSHLAARAERAFVRALGGGCTTPLAAYAQVDQAVLLIEGLLAAPDGSRILRQSVEGSIASPEGAGEELARRVLASADRDLLRACLGPDGGGN